MKYALTITKTAIQGGVKYPASFDIKLFDERKDAIAQAISLFMTELSNLSGGESIPYSSLNTVADNNYIVEARIFGEIEVIVIGVKWVKEKN